MTGETHALAVGKHSTVGDMQQSLCALFNKQYPHTKVSIVSNEIIYADFAASPFTKLPAEARVIFVAKVHVLLRKVDGATNELAVEPETSLRELQFLLCET